MKEHPIDVFKSFVNAKSYQKPQSQMFVQALWQQFIINENGKSDIFSPMEKTQLFEWHVC